MKNHRDLPRTLYTKEGVEVHTKGYVISAQMEAREEVRREWASYMLIEAAHKAIDLAGEQHVRDWCKQYLGVK